MKNLLFALIACISIQTLQGQTPYGDQPLAHTYSIVAMDSATGEMGVAVQSHWFSTGTIVIWGEAGTGVVATQSFVNPSFGPRGLELMKQGLTAEMAVDALTKLDEYREVRQLAMLDKNGNVGVFTGKNCIKMAGHVKGKYFSVQANLMEKSTVWDAMAKAFETTEGQLAERMMAALKAAQAEGGDIRGKQSAAMLVVAPENTGQPWVDRKVDLRVDDHKDPIKELERLLMVHRAYEHMNKGDKAVEEGDMTKANEHYGKAESLMPENTEMKFWHAVTLANTKDIKGATKLMKKVFKEDEKWKETLKRIREAGILTANDEDFQKLTKL